MDPRFKFGTSIDPRNVATAERAQVPVEFDSRKNCDPDRLLQCPFDKNHHIRASRFPFHIIKCRKNHPKLASELETCPYNARHLVPKHKMKRHTEICEDRVPVDADHDEDENKHRGWKVPVRNWGAPEMIEDWDKEEDQTAAPFVWRECKILNSNQETRPPNNLGPRGPHGHLWSGHKS
ncbi:gametocyte-specific factor 1-like [Aulostomus maculatus]